MDLWEQVHTARLAQTHGEGEPNPDAFADLATEETVEPLVDLVAAGRGDVPMELADVELWPQVRVSAGGEAATVEDCILAAVRSGSDADAEVTVRSHVWTGSAVATDDGWLLDALVPGEPDCVPPELNRELLDAYGAYHEAWTAAWDPPDPDHPLLEQTMTGQRLEEIRQVLREHQVEGFARRDPRDPLEHAVVFELGIGQATVSDCHEAHPEHGVYDVANGERLDEVIPPVEPGQLNLTSVDLVRGDDGEWRVVEAAGLRDTDCVPEGTGYVVAP